MSSSDERKPPIHMKHRSAGVFHIPDKMWKTSAFAAIPFNLKMSLNCAVTLSTIVRSSVSPACELTAALSSLICLLCSSSQRAYSTSNAKAPVDKRSQKDNFLSIKNLLEFPIKKSKNILIICFFKKIGKSAA